MSFINLGEILFEENFACAVKSKLIQNICQIMYEKSVIIKNVQC